MKKILSVLIFLVSIQHIQAQALESEVIEYIKQFPVSRLDSALSDDPFAVWLKGISGTSATFLWEMNDCGEQTGNPAIDAERVIPTCIGVQVTLSDQRVINIMVSVGNIESVEPQDASIYDIYLQTGKDFKNFKRLRDLQQQMKILYPR